MIATYAELGGALYASFKAGKKIGELDGSQVGKLALAVAAGYGIGALLPITGPVGLGIAAYDAYQHRAQIKAKYSDLRAKWNRRKLHVVA